MSESEKGAASAEDPDVEGRDAVRPPRVVDEGLSSRDRSILDFERDWQRHAEAKSDAVQSEFGLTPARYYQVLNGIIDSPAALAHNPMLVRRLQRVRDARASARTSCVQDSARSTSAPHQAAGPGNSSAAACA